MLMNIYSFSSRVHQPRRALFDTDSLARMSTHSSDSRSASSRYGRRQNTRGAAGIRHIEDAEIVTCLCDRDVEGPGVPLAEAKFLVGQALKVELVVDMPIQPRVEAEVPSLLVP